ncbi:hypothetical protein CHS0354_041946 [Potamilus streckersoni]|uniref:Uncharacterized protein n=1 Tax=Potamilus streckersoni TaxID=2493646 RepID=A0AAE0W9S2_9BIVA|nr:hypothetical protein CHS0354_041946 [Potamilus streckersoni]
MSRVQVIAHFPEEGDEGDEEELLTIKTRSLDEGGSVDLLGTRPLTSTLKDDSLIKELAMSGSVDKSELKSPFQLLAHLAKLGKEKSKVEIAAFSAILFK